MIHENKQAAVQRALQEAFGVNKMENIRRVTGGLSPSQVYRIIVQGKPFLLRLLLRDEKIADPTVEFLCMQTAAEAGIAPRVHYANVEDRILITDFVESRPFPEDMARRIAPLLRRLHILPHFPKPKMGSYINAMNGFVRRLQAAIPLSPGESEELFRRYAELVEVYPQNEAEWAACHNDLKPQNIRFDGERIWLVDWEAAFLNDPYVDLAVVANFFVANEAGEEDYLKAYFGQPASDIQRARFVLMRPMVSMFYAAFLLSMVARSGLAIAEDSPVPDFRAFHQRLIADEGEAVMATPAGQSQYARVHLQEALRILRSPRFAEALAQVRSAQTPSQPPARA